MLVDFTFNGYGEFSERQRQTVRGFVYGKQVADFGSGNLTLTFELLALGARHVLAVDPRSPPTGSPLVTQVRRFYGELQGDELPPYEVAFVAWPPCRPLRGLLPLLERARLVIYLGRCRDELRCGFPALFEAFLHRALLAYEPAPHNSLLVLGAPLAAPRLPTGEEAASLDPGHWTYEAVEHYDLAQTVARRALAR